MFSFLRIYQKYIFLAVAVISTITFAFFGVSSGPSNPNKVTDTYIGKKINGASLKKSELDQMVRFITSCRNDLQCSERNSYPNMLNEGIIQAELIDTGLAIRLIESYLPLLQQDISKSIAKHKQTKTYQHPQISTISVKNILSQVNPQQLTNLEKFQSLDSSNYLEAMKLLIELYKGEQKFPAYLIRNYLAFQEKHYDWVVPDPFLKDGNLSLFKCRSAKDWFSSDVVHIFAQFIINAAAFAEQNGIKVSNEQARAYLLKSGHECFNALSGKKKCGQKEMDSFMQMQFYHLGMSELDAIETCKKILLFKRLFHEKGSEVLFDSCIYNSFFKFAHETTEIELYRLPDHLHISNLDALMKLETYLSNVSKNYSIESPLPKEFLSVSKIEEKCPELIEQRFIVEVSSISPEDLFSNISLKQINEWQSDLENQKTLSKQFPSLKKLKGTIENNNFLKAIDHLDKKTQDDLLFFTKMEIVRAHPEWAVTALNATEPQKKIVSSSPCGKTFPYKDKDLLKLFKEAALNGENTDRKKAKEARQKLEIYPIGESKIYRFAILEKDLEKRIVFFKDALDNKILDQLVDNRLMKKYSELKESLSPLINDGKGGIKSFHDSKQDLGKSLFKSTIESLSSLKSKVQNRTGSLADKNLLDNAFSYRLHNHLSVVCKEVRKLGNLSKYVTDGSPQNAPLSLKDSPLLENQWSVVKQVQEVKYCDIRDDLPSDIFSRVEKSWSEVFAPNNGDLNFFQIIKRKAPESNYKEEMQSSQQLLSSEAKRDYLDVLIGELKAKNIIFIPTGRE